MGVSALTVYCRARNTRKTEKTTIEKLKDSIAELVGRMGKGVAVIENGDCLEYEDAKRVREVTGRFRFLSVIICQSISFRSPFRYDRHRGRC